MNFIVRKIRRWKFSKRCSSCHRKFMFKHNCKDIQKDGATVEFKDMPGIQDELNAIHNQHVDNEQIKRSQNICPTPKK